MRSMILLMVLLMTTTVAACSSGRGSEDTAFQPIRPTKPDVVCISDKLVAQILKHNLTGKKLYGWKE